MSTIPCRECGQRVTDPNHVERVTVWGRRRLAPSSGLQYAPRDEAFDLDMTTCDECANRAGRARAVLEAHPAARQPLGSMSFVMEIAVRALTALDVVRVKPAEQEALTRTDLDVARLLQRFRYGTTVSYAGRPSPVVGFEFEEGSRKPWEHLTEDQSQAMRDGYAALLQARTERPTDVSPPADGLPACLLCGVGTVRVLPSRAGQAWGPLRSANPGQIGGEYGPEPVRGHLCPACVEAASEHEAVGRAAMERSVFAFLGVKVPSWQDWSLPTVRAWAALPPGTPPNDTRWAHEPVERLAEELRAR